MLFFFFYTKKLTQATRTTTLFLGKNISAKSSTIYERIKEKKRAIVRKHSLHENDYFKIGDGFHSRLIGIWQQTEN